MSAAVATALTFTPFSFAEFNAEMDAAAASTRALTLANIQAAVARGLARAAAEGLVAYRAGAGYLVPSATDAGVEYSVVKCGHQWFAWSCSCPAGAHGRICKHVSLAVFATKYGVHAKRPEAPVVAQDEPAVSNGAPKLPVAEQVTSRYTAAWFAAEQARTDAVNARVDALFRH